MGKLIEALLTRLRVDSELSAEEQRAILALPIIPKSLSPGGEVARYGDRPHQSCLVADGYLARARTGAGGKRQLLSVHVPGDIPDLQTLHLHVIDHDLFALGHAEVGFISHDALHRLAVDWPGVAAALWRETLIEASIFRERIFTLGQMNAKVRLARFLVETRHRLAAIGRDSDVFELPMTQTDLADICGVTPVHLNRTLKELKQDGLVETRQRSILVRDRKGLEELAQFESLYLHQSPDL